MFSGLMSRWAMLCGLNHKLAFSQINETWIFAHQGVQIIKGSEEWSQYVPHCILFLYKISLASPQLAKEVTTTGIFLDQIDVLLIFKGTVELDDLFMFQSKMNPYLTLNLISAKGRKRGVG